MDCSEDEQAHQKENHFPAPKLGEDHPGKNDSSVNGRRVGIREEEVAERDETKNFTGCQGLSMKQGEPQSRMGQIHGQGQGQRTAKGTVTMPGIGRKGGKMGGMLMICDGRRLDPLLP